MAVYIEHVAVEFYDAVNHTKHVMTLYLFGDVGLWYWWSMDMDNMHDYIYSVGQKKQYG